MESTTPVRKDPTDRVHIGGHITRAERDAVRVACAKTGVNTTDVIRLALAQFVTAVEDWEGNVPPTMLGAALLKELEITH